MIPKLVMYKREWRGSQSFLFLTIEMKLAMTRASTTDLGKVEIFEYNASESDTRVRMLRTT
jgi:hypothetical protein